MLPTRKIIHTDLWITGPLGPIECLVTKTYDYVTETKMSLLPPSCSCKVASRVNASSESVSVASEQFPDVPLVSVLSRAPGCWYVWFGLRCRWYWCCKLCWWRLGWNSVVSSSHSPSLLSPRCWYGWYARFAFPVNKKSDFEKKIHIIRHWHHKTVV